MQGSRGQSTCRLEAALTLWKQRKKEKPQTPVQVQKHFSHVGGRSWSQGCCCRASHSSEKRPASGPHVMSCWLAAACGECDLREWGCQREGAPIRITSGNPFEQLLVSKIMFLIQFASLFVSFLLQQSISSLRAGTSFVVSISGS